MSFYGVVTDKETGEHHYRRVELMSNTPYTEAIVRLAYEFFRVMILPDSYTIWIYDAARESVKLVGRFN